MATLPPDTRTAGTPDPAGDNNALVDCLSTITGAAPGGTVTAQQTLDTLAGGVTNNQVLAGNGTHVTLRALTAADVAGTLDTTAADITVHGTQAAGSTGKPADAGHTHPAVNGTWQPGSGGAAFLGWNSDPCTGSGGSNLTAGGVYLQRLNFYQATTITNLLYIMATAGSGTNTGTFVGLYSSTGTRLTTSSDQASAFTGSTGLVTCPVTSPQSFTAGQFCWAALVINLATAMPVLLRQQNTAVYLNAGLTAANFRWCVNGSGQTSLPASITPSSNSTASPFNGNSLFVGWS